MEPVFKAKLIAALRSGKYPQGTGYLRSPTGYCCWGVACDLEDSSRWESTAPDARFVRFLAKLDQSLINSEHWYPPKDLMAKWGVYNENVAVMAAMNDQGVPFTEIANYLEENL